MICLSCKRRVWGIALSHAGMATIFSTRSFGLFRENVKLQSLVRAILAQLVEQFTRNEQVVGSSPMDGSNTASRWMRFFQ
jgi:hypothetical protein